MTPTEIIRQVTADGVRLCLTEDGTVRAIGVPAKVNRWARAIREHKPDIMAALAVETDREAFEERAAIMEFDGGMTRLDAERMAMELIAKIKGKCRNFNTKD